MIVYHESKRALVRFVACYIQVFEHVHIREPCPWIRSGSSLLMLNPVGSVRNAVHSSGLNILLLDVRFFVYKTFALIPPFAYG